MRTMGTYERPFSEEEYAARRERAVAAAEAEGMDGLIVWSRGGGTNDRHGNALYLANAYSSFPFVPNNMPLWGGRAHAVLFLPVGGPSQLIVDIPYYDAEGVAVDQVRVSPNVLDAVADALREKGLDEGGLDWSAATYCRSAGTGTSMRRCPNSSGSPPTISSTASGRSKVRQSRP